MNAAEFEARIETYKEEVKESGKERPLSQDEIRDIADSIANIPSDYIDAFNMAVDGNFSKFEKLPYLLRNYLGALKVQEFKEQCGENPSLEDERTRRYLADNAMNAAFRAGITAEKNAPQTKASATAFDTYMNTTLLQNTLKPPTNEEISALGDHYGYNGPTNAALEKNLQKQLVMAKTLFLAQLGKYNLVGENGVQGELNEPLSETLVHGSRTNFILPVGEGSQEVLDTFVGRNGGADAGIEKRAAATHYVKRRAVDKNGMIKSHMKESKTFSPLKVFSNQYGMDIAVGGMGKRGPDGNVITGEGESGHVYMRLEKGDAKHCGSLMIGIEGSAPGKSSYLGNDHGIRAKSAKQSAFLAGKSIIGKKVGGRQIDLSGIKSSDLVDALKLFERAYKDMQQNAVTSNKNGVDYWSNKLTDINTMLMGKPMDKDKMMQLFETLNMKDPRLSNMLNDARRGYLDGVKAENIKKSEFEQIIRKGIGQKEACRLADERFAAAGEDKTLAVGAVKELMRTHDTRKRSWRIFHPFKNSDEKSKIKELTKRLEKEHNMTPTEIANALASSDSFTLPYGAGLTNDPDALKFIEKNRNMFKSELSAKAARVLQMATNALLEDPVEEVKQQTNKLDKDPNRVSIVINEVKETRDTKNLSPMVDKEPPSKTHYKEF